MSRTNSSSAGGWSREQPASSGSKRVRALSSGGGIGGGVGGVMKREISTKRAFGIVNQQDRSFSQRDCEGVHGQMTMDNRSQIQTQVIFNRSIIVQRN